MEQMADRIKRLRLQHGLTQEELGNIIGVQKSAIRKYESGAVQNIKRTSIKKLADYFGVSPSYLLGYEDKEPEIEAKKPVSDSDLKVALFGADEEVTDEMWDKVKEYADYIKNKYGK